LDWRRDLAVLRGTRKSIGLTAEQFKAVTGQATFPPMLQEFVRGDRLDYVAFNSVSYTVRGVHVKLDVAWDFEAPPGGKDTELAIFRGTRARIEVRQAREENFTPEVYVVPQRTADRPVIAAALERRLQQLAPTLAGLEVRDDGARLHIVIPAALRISHEAHFALLVRQFLAYQRQPETLPAWENSFLLAKYRVTTEGVRLGRLAPTAAVTRATPSLP
jgi:hypothetical protein